jgi:hypothetical protein
LAVAQSKDAQEMLLQSRVDLTETKKEFSSLKDTFRPYPQPSIHQSRLHIQLLLSQASPESCLK